MSAEAAVTSGQAVHSVAAAREDPAMLVRTEDVQMHFSAGPEFGRGAVIRAVNGVSLSVSEGEMLCVVGESGCGKSTLARVIAGLYRPTSGKVYFEETRSDSLPARERRRYCRFLQMIFQNPAASLNPRMTVGQALEEVLRFHFPEMDAAARRERAVTALRETGLEEDALSRWPHQFSGGQLQRISIARALVVAPRFLIADEPIAALDVSVQAQILNLLLELRSTRRIACLFITHDLSVVRHFGDRAAVMYLGEVCEQAAVGDLFERPRHPYTRILLEAAPQIGKPPHAAKLPGEPPSPLNLPSGCAFHPRCPHASDRCRSERPMLRQTGGSWTACHAVEEGRI